MNEHLEPLLSERGAPMAPNTPRKLPHSLDMESILTADLGRAITDNLNRPPPATKTALNFRYMELLIHVVTSHNYSASLVSQAKRNSTPERAGAMAGHQHQHQQAQLLSVTDQKQPKETGEKYFERTATRGGITLRRVADLADPVQQRGGCPKPGEPSYFRGRIPTNSANRNNTNHTRTEGTYASHKSIEKAAIEQFDRRPYQVYLCQADVFGGSAPASLAN